MTINTHTLSAALIAVAGITSSTSLAAEPAPLDGVEVSIRGGLLFAFPVGFSAEVGASVGYKFDHFALGLAVDWGLGNSAVMDVWRVGAYAHYHVAPQDTFDAWLGLTTSAILGGDEVGLDVAAEVGLDIGGPSFAAGPFLSISTGTLGDGYAIAVLGARVRATF